MDFDSPDGEKDFPGVYAATEVGHKDSDGKKLIGKKKKNAVLGVWSRQH